MPVVRVVVSSALTICFGLLEVTPFMGALFMDFFKKFKVYV